VAVAAEAAGLAGQTQVAQATWNACRASSAQVVGRVQAVGPEGEPGGALSVRAAGAVVLAMAMGVAMSADPV
jgi:hypothetical protein